jgi:hypothetical protein
MVEIEKTAFGGWCNCYRVSNGAIEAIVTGDVGPRVMSFGFSGGQNFFKEFPDQLGRTGEETWQPRGGHRLWAAPEDAVKTYVPDNSTVHIAIDGNTLHATGSVEALTGLEKRISMTMAPAGTRVEVVHRIRNAGNETISLAPWALTMFAPGGTGIHGFPPRLPYPEALAVSSPLVMWAYTDFTDQRWKLLYKYLVLRQDPHHPSPQKAGTFNPDTWGAYLLNRELFVKRSRAEGPVASYTDHGCSFETFTNGDFLELETLGPVTQLAPGAVVTHIEQWSAYRGVEITCWDDPGLDRVLGPLLES